MKNTFYLGGIVIFYWLIKEEIFDGGMKKICLVDLYRIPRSGSVLMVMVSRKTCGGVATHSKKLQF
jgi:hypothetical protein